LARANFNTLLLEEESFAVKSRTSNGSRIISGFAEGVSGAQLAGQMEGRP